MIEDFGWSELVARAFAPHAALDLLPGRVIVQHRGLYTLATDVGEAVASLAGRFVHQAAEGDFPTVGDWVAFTTAGHAGPKNSESAIIHDVLPRRTAFSRKAADSVQTLQVVAANVDIALLIASMNADFNERRLERYLAAAWQSGAAPLVVLTKADLFADPQQFVVRAEAVAFGVPVLPVSALTGQGLDALAARLAPGETCVLLGSSGAGKSTLLNALAGAALAATAPIREADAQGRHTTTHRELMRLGPGALAPGTLVLDTPGMRELGLIEASEGVDATFEDIKALGHHCRFADCAHGAEPGCAVRAALEDGRLDPARWRGFDKLRRELAHQERREDRLARETERRRWITIHKAGRAARKGKERW